MTPIQRVRCVLEGRRPDRPPVSFWYHFESDCVHGPSAVQAHVNHVEAYDLDFLKVMNDNGYPCRTPLAGVADLKSLVELTGTESNFTRQLDLLSDLKKRLGEKVLMATTVFNAWATLRRLVKPPTSHGPPVIDGSDDEVSTLIKTWYTENPQLVKTALNTIAANLSRFAGRCIDAGADGVFLSVRDDWLKKFDGAPVEKGKDDAHPSSGASGRLYDELVRPADLTILRGASAGQFNLLHVCGSPVDLRAFLRYPVHAINWADRAAGPSIAHAIAWGGAAICAGIDNQSTLPTGSPEACQAEVADALAQAGDRPILLAPGCTYDPAIVPKSNLEAVCQAARQAG